MTTADKNKISSFISHVQDMIEVQKKYSKAKTAGEPGKARALSNDFVIVRTKVEAELAECKAIVSADQGSLF